MPRQVLTPADRADVARWAREGLSDVEIARKLGKITPSGIFAFRTRAGIPTAWVKPLNALERGDHGTDTAWNLGCKCPECSAAHTARQKRTIASLQARTAGGARQQEPWEPWEVELLLSPRRQGELEILARFLGRTYSACGQRATRARKAAAEGEGSGTLF